MGSGCPRQQLFISPRLVQPQGLWAAAPNQRRPGAASVLPVTAPHQSSPGVASVPPAAAPHQFRPGTASVTPEAAPHRRRLGAASGIAGSSASSAPPWRRLRDRRQQRLLSAGLVPPRRSLQQLLISPRLASHRCSRQRLLISAG
jgi:hypothetical protein